MHRVALTSEPWRLEHRLQRPTHLWFFKMGHQQPQLIQRSVLKCSILGRVAYLNWQSTAAASSEVDDQSDRVFEDYGVKRSCWDG